MSFVMVQPVPLMVLIDMDKREPHLHGVMEMRFGESVEDAQAAIDEAVQRVKDEAIDGEWNYDDVIEILNANSHPVAQDCHLWIEE